MAFDILQPDQLYHLIKRSDADQVILDVRSRRQAYLAGHIPGAVHTTWESWNEMPPAGVSEQLRQPGWWGVLKEPTIEVARQIEALGISNSSLVVVYANGLEDYGREARIAWMLLYWGVKQVRLLDRGYSGWLRIGGPVEIGEEKPKSFGKFNFNLQPQRRISLPELKKIYSDAVLFDTRSEGEYTGALYDYMPRKGAIPVQFSIKVFTENHNNYSIMAVCYAYCDSSILLPYSSLFGPDGSFIKREEFRKVISHADTRKPWIALCEIIPNYDGSMMEWGLYRELPIVCKHKPDKK